MKAEDGDVTRIGGGVVPGVVGGQVLARTAASAAGARTFGSFGNHPPPVLRQGALLAVSPFAASLLAYLVVVTPAAMSGIGCFLADGADTHSRHGLYIG